MTKRVSRVKSSPTPSKNLRTSREEELRLYISFDELKSPWRERGRVWPPGARGKKRRSWKKRVVRENEGRAELERDAKNKRRAL